MYPHPQGGGGRRNRDSLSHATRVQASEGTSLVEAQPWGAASWRPTQPGGPRGVHPRHAPVYSLSASPLPSCTHTPTRVRQARLRAERPHMCAPLPPGGAWELSLQTDVHPCGAYAALRWTRPLRPLLAGGQSQSGPCLGVWSPHPLGGQSEECPPTSGQAGPRPLHLHPRRALSPDVLCPSLSWRRGWGPGPPGGLSILCPPPASAQDGHSEATCPLSLCCP